MVDSAVKVKLTKVKVDPHLHAITLQPNIRYASSLDC